MPFTKTESTTNTANHNFDSAKIEIVSGKYQLKLNDNPGVQFNQTFSSDSGFTYDSAKSEFTSGRVQQKSQIPTNSIFGATFSSSLDGSWGVGVSSLTHTKIGAPTLASGKLACTGNQGIYYQDSAFGTLAGVGYMYCEYVPNYTTSPPANTQIMELAPTTGTANRICLFNSPSGNNIRITVTDTTGNTFYNAETIATWTPTAGNTYKFLITWDFDTDSVIKVYVNDGAGGALSQLGSNKSTFSFSRGTTATRFYLGSGSTYTQGNGSWDNVLVGNVEQALPFAPTVPNYIYANTTVALPNFTYTGVGTVQSVDNAIITESGSPKYIIGLQYWDGDSWEISDGTYAQATDSATAVANFTSFNAGGGGVLPVSIVFPDSNTQSYVDDIQVEITGQIYPTDNPPLSTEVLAVDDITSVSSIFSATGSDAIKASLVYMGSCYYWDGGGWEVCPSDTYTYTNTFSDISTNIDAFDFGLGGTFYFKIYFHSDDGTSTPTLTNVVYVYDYFKIISSPSECVIYGYILDLKGDPVSGATITFDKEPFFHGDNLMAVSASVTSLSNGWFEASIVQTETVGEGVNITVSYTDNSTSETITYSDIIIPNQDTAALGSIV